MRYLGLPRAPRVIYNGLSPAFSPESLGGAPPRGEFLLALGNHKPYKNLSTLIEAYRLLSEPPPLTVVTDDPGAFGSIPGVTFVSNVSDETLRTLYQTCRLFLFPSLYEGFGLPPLEAGACGAPVLAHRGSSLPEILGPGAFYTDARSPQSLAQSLGHILSLCPAEITQATALLRDRARGFSWQRTARETLDAYDHVWAENFPPSPRV